MICFWPCDACRVFRCRKHETKSDNKIKRAHWPKCHPFENNAICSLTLQNHFILLICFHWNFYSQFKYFENAWWRASPVSTMLRRCLFTFCVLCVCKRRKKGKKMKTKIHRNQHISFVEKTRRFAVFYLYKYNFILMLRKACRSIFIGIV